MNLVNKKFGRLKVHNLEGKRNHRLMWMCKCDCGRVAVVTTSSLLSGKTQSCGCLRIECLIVRNTTHGKYSHPLYGRWSTMIGRCENKNHFHYKDYGGRGITVCRRWHKFEKFLEDMEDGFKLGLEIERKNNSGNYSPSNCVWATRTEQTNNSRKNVRIEKDGVSKTVSQWARTTGIGRSTIQARIARLGWTPERAVSTPVNL